MMITHSNKPLWKKNLYEKQDYPDNYTDPKIFLKDLRKNVHLKKITIKQACFGASFLLHEYCAVIFFLIIYLYLLNNHWIDPFIILYSISAITLICFLLYQKYSTNKSSSYSHNIRTTLTFIAFGQLFSPVLHTLTDTISTDTIYTMTFLMMLTYLIFYDYRLVSAAIVSNSLSTCAAMFASICLASRLASAFNSFILLTVATQIFVLSPLILRNLLIRKSELILFSITILMFLINLVILYFLSIIALALFLLGSLLINLICPLLFVHYQEYKDNIYGPWDEAIIV